MSHPVIYHIDYTMKIVQQNRGKIISVLGMPHGGTTIVCNIFNSMENAFCLSEPHWTLLSNPSALRLDKVRGLSFKAPDEILPAIQAKLDSDDSLNFAGLKETYRPKEPRMKPYFAKMLASDIVVLVFRDPKAHYNSLKVMSKRHNKNPMPLSYMVNSFDSLYDVAIKAHDNGNGILISLEDLCAVGNQGAIQYINNRAGNILQVHGKFEIKPTNYIYGNPKANRSKNIAPANTATNLLTPDEIKEIDQTMSQKYGEIRKLVPKTDHV